MFYITHSHNSLLKVNPTKLNQMSSFTTMECKYLTKILFKDATKISFRLWWQNDNLAYNFIFWLRLLEQINIARWNHLFPSFLFQQHLKEILQLINCFNDKKKKTMKRRDYSLIILWITFVQLLSMKQNSRKSFRENLTVCSCRLYSHLTLYSIIRFVFKIGF